MRKFIDILLVLWVATILCRGEESGKDPSLLFEANYNSWNVTANYAKGDKHCLSFDNPDLQLRMFAGLKDSGALKISNREYCEYRMTNNFDPRQGTVSLWVAPQNWQVD